MATRAKTIENLTEALEDFCKDIEQTGGIVFDEDGNPVPAADETWIDLAETYFKACMVLNRKPVVAEKEKCIDCGGTNIQEGTCVDCMREDGFEVD